MSLADLGPDFLGENVQAAENMVNSTHLCGDQIFCLCHSGKHESFEHFNGIEILFFTSGRSL